MRHRQSRRHTALRAATRSAFRAIDTLESRTHLDATYFNLSTGPLSQNWEDSSQITVDDNWSGVPSIVGYRGDNQTATTAFDPQTVTADDATVAPVVDINHDRNTVVPSDTPSAFSTGGLAEFAIPTPIGAAGHTTGANTVAFQGSGTADAPYLVFYLNTTGRTGVHVKYDLIDIDAGTTTAVQPVALQYRVGGGTWTNLPDYYVANAADTAASTAGKTTSIDATLPAAVDNAAQVEVRVITIDATGSDQFIAVDNIVVSSSPTTGGPGAISFNPATYNLQETAGTQNITVRRSSANGAVSATYTIVAGTATTPADFTGTLTGTVSFADGVDTATIPVTIVNDTDIESTESFTVNLSNPTGGATIGSGTATVNILDDDTPIPGTIAFNPSFLSVNENAGTATLTVKRTVGTGGPVSATYTITPGTASAPADFNGPGGTLTGTVNFANGQDTATIVLTIVNDTILEQTENLTVTLSNPTGGASLGSAVTATVNITDNDAVLPTGLLINELSIDTFQNNTPYSFLELRGTPGQTLGQVYLISIEGDQASNPGSINAILDLSGATIGSNGILLVKAADIPDVGSQGFSPVDPNSGVFKTSFLSSTATGFQVGTNSFLLAYRDGNGAALPSSGTDLDAENVAVDRATDPKLGLEGLPASVTLLDSIAVSDGGTGDVGYGPTVAALTVGTTPAAADMVIRNGNNTNAFDLSAFYGGEFTGASDSIAIGTPTFGTVPEGATLTPGGANPGTAVVDTTPPTVTGVTFDRYAAQPTVTITFSEDIRDVANPVTASDFTLINNTTGQTVPASAMIVAIASDGKSATVVFNNIPGAPKPKLLPSGNYTFTVNAGSYADVAGNTGTTPGSGTFRYQVADMVGPNGTTADGKVGFEDLVLLAQNYGKTGKTFAQGDADYDGDVDFDDLVLLAQNYGKSLPAPAPIFAPAMTGTPIIGNGKKNFGDKVIV